MRFKITSEMRWSLTGCDLQPWRRHIRNEEEDEPVVYNKAKIWLHILTESLWRVTHSTKSTHCTATCLIILLQSCYASHWCCDLVPCGVYDSHHLILRSADYIPSYPWFQVRACVIHEAKVWQCGDLYHLYQQGENSLRFRLLPRMQI